MPIKKLRRITDLTVVSAEDEMRRAYGVGELVKLMSDKPVPGKSYHIITGGAIDLICHLYWLLRHWPHMKKVLISAWAISGRDILFLEKLLKDGQIDRVELLVGDIFPTKYKMEWKKLMEIYDSGGISAVYKSTIHSKLLLMEAEDGTKLVIESSANCNMNPRVEQSCVTVSEKLYDFYFTYLHEMFDEEQARRTARETLKLPLDEYISDSERLAEVGENDLVEEMDE